MEFLENEKMFHGIFIKLAILLFQCLLAISDERLPGNVKPERYILDLSTNLGAASNEDIYRSLFMTPEETLNEQAIWSRFFGSVEIQVWCTKSTKSIVLHAEKLLINENNIRVSNTDTDTPIEATGKPYSPGQYIIYLREALIAEKMYTIRLEFSNSADSSVGFIFNPLSSEAYTQTDKDIARYIFPCFDHIELKAKFKIILKHKEGFNGFSMTDYVRMYISETTRWVVEEFEPLEHPFSTYSVTLAVTQSTCILTQAGHNTYYLSPIRISYCSSDFIENSMMDCVCENIANILAFISRFLKMAYPLKKFDVFCMLKPVQLTEGYGLLIAGPNYLSTVTHKIYSDEFEYYAFNYEGIKRLCNVLSHQWFGHIVTIDWEESWFHDGLNIYIQWLCAAEVYSCGQPENSNYRAVCCINYIENVRLCNSNFEQKNQITEPFDVNWIDEGLQYPDYKWDIISSFLHIMKREETGDWILMPTGNSNWAYEPGSDEIKHRATHLIRMVDFIMETKKFQFAIQKYLKKYKYKNTNLDDVWASWTRTAVKYSPPVPFNENLNVKNIMKNWINQNGHPLIIVERNYNTGEVRLRQEPFTVLMETEVEGSSLARERCWTIPLRYRTKDGHISSAQVPHWFTCEDEESPNEPSLMYQYLPIENLESNYWIIMDLELDVLCRVLYDAENWNLIKTYLLDNPMQTEISELNKLRLISDMFTLAKAGRLSYQIVFETMSYLKQETSYAVWKVAIDELHEIQSRLLGSTLGLYEGFKEYMRRLLEPMFEERKDTDYKFQFAYPSELNLSILIMEQSCIFGVKSCIKLGSQIIKGDPSLTSIGYSKIPYSINKAINCQKVVKSDKYRRRLWEKYSTSKNSSRIELILMALGCSRSSKYLNSYLESSLNSLIVSHDERLIIFRSVSLNFKGYRIIKEFFLSHYDEFFNRHSESSGVSIISYWKILLDATNRQNDLDELKEFARQHADFQSEWMQKSIANAERNILWHRISANSAQEVISSFPSCSGSRCPMM